MKKRLKNWITSILGVLLFIFAGVALYLGKFSVWESLPLFALGYTFLMAKDSVLEGLTMGILKVKSK